MADATGPELHAAVTRLREQPLSDPLARTEDWGPGAVETGRAVSTASHAQRRRRDVP